MKKLANKILTSTADAALEAVIKAAGIPSLGGAYQAKEPKNLQQVAANRKMR